MQAVRPNHGYAPSVSVLVAAFKADRYLKDALTDVVRQTYADFEVLVFDDADSIETRQLIESFQDARLVYKANSTRLGAAGNYRSLLDAARGEFVAILNHDDRWDSNFLETLIAPLQRDAGLVLTFCNHRVIDAEGRERPEQAARMSKQYKRDRLTPGRQASIAPLFIDQSLSTVIGCLFRRRVIDAMELKTTSGPAYDLWLAYLFAKSSGAAFYFAESLVAWREHSANITSQGDLGWTSGTIDCWERALRDSQFAPYKAIVRKKLALTLRHRAMQNMQRGDFAGAKSDGLRGFAMRWWDPKTAFAMLLIMGRKAISAPQPR